MIASHLRKAEEATEASVRRSMQTCLKQLKPQKQRPEDRNHCRPRPRTHPCVAGAAPGWNFSTAVAW